MLIIFFVCSCGQHAANNSNTNANTSPPPSANANSSAEAPKTLETQLDSALKEFIAKHYKGWQMQGFVANKKDLPIKEFGEDPVQVLDCTDEPCNLHLTKGKEDKVVSVIAKQFEKPDGTLYWLFYEASKLDLLRNRIQQERDEAYEEGVEYAKANLDTDDCREVIEAMVDDRAADEYEPPDYP